MCWCPTARFSHRRCPLEHFLTHMKQVPVPGTQGGLASAVQAPAARRDSAGKSCPRPQGSAGDSPHGPLLLQGSDPGAGTTGTPSTEPGGGAKVTRALRSCYHLGAGSCPLQARAGTLRQHRATPRGHERGQGCPGSMRQTPRSHCAATRLAPMGCAQQVTWAPLGD